MNKQFETIIGLEIHIQVKTKAKMFCRCSSAYFHAKPNINTCPVCFGLPGALPVPNKAAIDKCLKLGLALDCQINKYSKFDRKNYFYPDLAKGYQISQYDKPFCFDGFLEINSNDDAKRIRIRRVHMEEDTAKSTHNGDETLIDFNKSGVPLVEVVTEPDFRSTKEVLDFAKRLKQVVKYADISDADMEKGQMRFELNISLREAGTSGLPDYRVEIKNISSISVLEKAIHYEVQRQSEILNSGKFPVQETRGLKDMTGKTYARRQKEEASDYRYFPEPDIPPITFEDKEIQDIKSAIIELPNAKLHRYQSEFGLETNLIEPIILTKAKALWFEEAISNATDKNIVKEIAKWYVGDLFSLMKLNKVSINKLKITPKNLFELIEILKKGEITGTIAKQILTEMFETGSSAASIIEAKGLRVQNDSNEIGELVKKVIDANPRVMDDIKKNPNASKFLLGLVMRESKGRANPKIIETEINKILSNI